MTTAKSSDISDKSIELKPSYRLPFVILLAAIPLSLLTIWIGGVIALLGLFLWFQAATIRLKFTETALEVCRLEKTLKTFPYADWLYWRIFWQNVPILFYFREVKSIHFLPILFDPKMLLTCLEQNFPLEENNEVAL